MAKIAIVDDDYAIESLVECLGFLGHEVRRFASADQALQNLQSIIGFDLLILDVIMPPSELHISGGRNTGMSIFQQVRKLKTDLPILAYSATSDTDTISILRGDAHTTYLPKWSAPTLKDVNRHICTILGVEDAETLPRPFIVHGHDEVTKLALKNYLQNTIKLPEPIILHEQPSLGKSLIEKFEHYAARSHLVFVLLTPDDKAAAMSAPDDEKRRARQNVIFELGFFLGMFGRSSGRVFLLYKGPLEIPSDLAGVCYIDITAGVESAGEIIRREIARVH